MTLQSLIPAVARFIPGLAPFIPILQQKFGSVESHSNNTSDQIDNAYQTGAASNSSPSEWGAEATQRLSGQPQICWPVTRVPVVVTSKFGYRNLQKGDPKTFHIGVDFKTRDAKTVVACEKALVFEIIRPDYKYPCLFTFDSKTERWVKTAPAGRAWTPRIVLIGKFSNNKYVYKHVDASKKLKEGMVVEVGQPIGEAGNLGYSQGEHLHFEWYDFLEQKQKWAPAGDAMVFFQKHAHLMTDSRTPVIVNEQIFHGAVQ